MNDEKLTPIYKMIVAFVFGYMVYYIFFSDEEKQVADSKPKAPVVEKKLTENDPDIPEIPEQAVTKLEKKVAEANKPEQENQPAIDEPEEPTPSEPKKELSHHDTSLPMEQRMKLWEANYKNANKQRVKRLAKLNPDAAKTLKEDIIEHGKFPPSDHRMKQKSADPIKTLLRPNIKTIKANIGGSQVAIQAWARRNFYKEDDTIKISVTLQEIIEQASDSRQTAVKSLNKNKSQQVLENLSFSLLKWQDEKMTELEQPLPKLVAEKENTLYSMSFKINPEMVYDIEGSYDVKVSVPKETVGEGKENILLNFTVSVDYGHFTKNAKDSAKEGNLSLEVEVNILKKGEYSFSGSIYDLDHNPVATKEFALELAEGTHWVDFNFYGYLFHEAKAFGPFVLKNVIFKRISNSVLYVGDEKSLNFHTKEYRPEDFINQPWQSFD